MIRKIICPTDFSPAANNATAYAAKLAQVFNAELFLVHVERLRPVMAGASLAGITNESEKVLVNAQLKQLESISADVHRTYKVICDYEVDISSQSFAKTVARLANENTMIVMGSNGAEDLYQFYFGTNTYHVIREASCPVLLVPENTPYGTYHDILYALTYEEKGRLALSSLCEFAKHYEKARYTFLHVSKSDTAISQDVYDAMKDEVEASCTGMIKPQFKRIFAEYPGDGIDEYLRNNKVDLLVMVAHHRNVFESIFKQKPVLDGISAVPALPVLVFHA